MREVDVPAFLEGRDPKAMLLLMRCIAARPDVASVFPTRPARFQMTDACLAGAVVRFYCADSRKRAQGTVTPVEHTRQATDIGSPLLGNILREHMPLALGVPLLHARFLLAGGALLGPPLRRFRRFRTRVR